jgi:flagellar motor switch protein FliM
MAQDFLSQEEVDALLKGVAGETDEEAPNAVTPAASNPTI